MKKKIGIGIIITLIVIQIVRIDTAPLIYDNSTDILNIYEADEDIESIIEAACYDCHSNETKYPWYSQIAPVSWWMKRHINHGRDELNFSEWADYDISTQQHLIKESIEKIIEKKMPLSSYALMHPKARLDDNQREKLVDWFKSLE